MRHLRMPRLALVRWYTIGVAVLCGAAVTLIVHDLPASQAAAQRRAQAVAWKTEAAAARDRVTAVNVARLRLRRSYNQLVLTSHAREQRLLAAVHRWRRVAAQR